MANNFSCLFEEICSFNIVNLIDLPYINRTINRVAHTGIQAPVGSKFQETGFQVF